MGFAPDADMPSGFRAVSNVPLVAPTGTENLLDCGDPCPWHGTNVASAAFALPGNGFRSAGPAGPVADPLPFFTSYDYFTSISAMLAACTLDARIANMSCSTPVPSLLDFTVLPFEAATAALRASWMLLFASAGNDGKNVDAEAKEPLFGFGLGFEGTWHTPCENAGVICVGGVASNSLPRAGGSNFGSEQVDLFAPYSLWLGPDPSAPDNAVSVKNGTSFSSPFAAGVAALVCVADPSLSTSDVEDVLFASAKSSPDGKVVRVVDVLGARFHPAWWEPQIGLARMASALLFLPFLAGGMHKYESALGHPNRQPRLGDLQKMSERVEIGIKLRLHPRHSYNGPRSHLTHDSPCEPSRSYLKGAPVDRPSLFASCPPNEKHRRIL